MMIHDCECERSLFVVNDEALFKNSVIVIFSIRRMTSLLEVPNRAALHPNRINQVHLTGHFLA